jgi:hypothetical protein
LHIYIFLEVSKHTGIAYLFLFPQMYESPGIDINSLPASTVHSPAFYDISNMPLPVLPDPLPEVPGIGVPTPIAPDDTVPPSSAVSPPLIPIPVAPEA